MIIDDKSMDNNIIVILADSKEIALAHFTKVRPSTTTGVLSLHQRSEMYLLYGHRGMPFTIVPGTLMQDWHSELDHHIKWGRIVPIGKYRRVRVG